MIAVGSQTCHPRDENELTAEVGQGSGWDSTLDLVAILKLTVSVVHPNELLGYANLLQLRGTPLSRVGAGSGRY